MLRLLSRFTSSLAGILRLVTYTTPAPTTVSNGDTFQASSYNIISADIQDHESRIAAIESDLTTTTGTGTIAVGGYADITFPTGFNFLNMILSTYETAAGVANYLRINFLNGSTPYSSALYDFSSSGGSSAGQTYGLLGARMYANASGIYTSVENIGFDIRSDSTHYPNWNSSGTRFISGSSPSSFVSYGQYRSNSSTITGVRVTNATGSYPVGYECIIRGVS